MLVGMAHTCKSDCRRRRRCFLEDNLFHAGKNTTSNNKETFNKILSPHLKTAFIYINISVMPLSIFIYGTWIWAPKITIIGIIIIIIIIIHACTCTFYVCIETKQNCRVYDPLMNDIDKTYESARGWGSRINWSIHLFRIMIV